MPNSFERVLLIVNPTAQNGRAAQAAVFAAERLRGRLEADSVVVRETEYAKHAIELAREARGFDLVLALGGDGLAHEVINGLMQQPSDDRPVFGLIPVGSGNDYAASLGISGRVDKAVDQLLDAQIRMADVGCCNGEYYAETVSFGLDAAIAIDTMERRKRTGRTGTMLYFAAGIDQMLHHLDLHSFRMTLADGRSMSGKAYLLAVQNGQTYGGGFKVCPQSRLNDGILDICIAHPPLNALTATALFVRAKEGLHVGAKQIEFARTEALRIEFDGTVPAQIDGELLEGTSFDISVVPRALRVLAPADHSFASEAGSDYVRIPE